MTQRWLFGRTKYVRPDTVINPRDFEVAPIASRKLVNAFVAEHHYAGDTPPSRFRFGLYRRGQLAGVAVFSVPMSAGVLGNVFGSAAAESIELGRLVLLDQVEANGESWFVSRAFELLRREGIAGVLSFSDPVERRSASGHLVKRGHLGIVYRALNAHYLGRSTPRTLRLLPDGSVLSARTIQKALAGEKGCWRTPAMLEAAGAPPAPRDKADLADWVKTWLPKVTRTMRHAGNFRYAWMFDRRVKLPASLPYPKGF